MKEGKRANKRSKTQRLREALAATDALLADPDPDTWERVHVLIGVEPPISHDELVRLLQHLRHALKEELRCTSTTD